MVFRHGVRGYWLNFYFLIFHFYSIAKLVSSFFIFLFEMVVYIPVEACLSKTVEGRTKRCYTLTNSKLNAVHDHSIFPAFYNTCVGLPLKDNFMRIGKCHDSSCRFFQLIKYMMYSLLIYQTWMVVMVYSCVEFLFYLLQIGRAHV